MNHTKGKWKVVGGEIKSGNKSIVTLWAKKTDKEFNANANLIAAAPALLEACEYAFKNLQPKGNISKDFEGHNAKATLSKAIALAEESK